MGVSKYHPVKGTRPGVHPAAYPSQLDASLVSPYGPTPRAAYT